MLLKAGAISLVLLLASRLLGLLRESAQAAAFGSTGLADIVVLMLSLPDWLAGVVASGALAYVLLPAWAGQPARQVAASQRRVAFGLLALAVVLALALLVWRVPVQAVLVGGLRPPWSDAASHGLVWAALAVPAAFLAALWVTRLQHERDFGGMYAASLVVNATLVGALWLAGARPAAQALAWVGAGLVLAMLARLAWLYGRLLRVAPLDAPPADAGASAPLPPASPSATTSVWLWAALSAGLPLALPFAARSIASSAGEGALATFNYAWKLLELPLMLAIQLVATLSFPRIAHALSAAPGATARFTADGGSTTGSAADADADWAVRGSFALAWALACAAVAGLLVGASALAQLLFGWGRMDAAALAQMALWGRSGAWGLLPQALIAVGLTVLASRRRMLPAVLAYAAALLALLGLAAGGLHDGAALMMAMNLLLAGVALVTVRAMGPAWRRWMPWASLAWPVLPLAAVAALSHRWPHDSLGTVPGLLAAGVAGLLVLGVAWLGSPPLRAALRR